MFTAYFEHSVGFRSDINANLMQEVCFLTRDGKLPFILGADFNFPPCLWQDLSMHGCNAQMAVPSTERRNSPSSRWSSETVKETSHQTRNVQRSCTLTSGNVSGGSEDAIGFVKEINSIRALREKHVAEARAVSVYELMIFASLVSFPSKTANGLDQHVFTDLLDNALNSLGEIIRRCFVKLAIPIQSLLQENVGSRTIAILHTTCRLTMHLVSAHISQWDVKFAGKWNTAMKGNPALRAHVARAAGIELAHSEGQYWVFRWLGPFPTHD